MVGSRPVADDETTAPSVTRSTATLNPRSNSERDIGGLLITRQGRCEAGDRPVVVKAGN
jgi:hypothetical protein